MVNCWVRGTYELVDFKNDFNKKYVQGILFTLPSCWANKTHTHCSMTLFLLLFIENCYFCNFSIIKEHEKKIYFRKKKVITKCKHVKV